MRERVAGRGRAWDGGGGKREREGGIERRKRGGSSAFVARL